jgi:tRNA-specific 2-thiouridylase
MKRDDSFMIPNASVDDPIHVLVSGGVDSSVALARLKAGGYTNIHAYYLKIWLEDDLSSLGECPWEEDLSYARAVCKQCDVPLRVVPLQLEYHDRVVEYTLAELREGRTPSPDIFCNQRVKFGAFLDHISGPGWVASGHYAQIVRSGQEVHLYRAPDPVKDQTYFLSHLSQEQLSRLVFPVGNLPKGRVRRIAENMQLATMKRPDSQGICFLGKIRYPDFVRHYLGDAPGDIVERESGAVLGAHRGFWFHTIGQRQGLGLGNGPWYVTGKDTRKNIVYVSHASRVAEAAKSTLYLTRFNWIGSRPADGRYGVKLRHGPLVAGCSIRVDSSAEGSVTVELDVPDRGAAPGQFAILYDDERCLGGGMISSFGEKETVLSEEANTCVS